MLLPLFSELAYLLPAATIVITMVGPLGIALPPPLRFDGTDGGSVCVEVTSALYHCAELPPPDVAIALNAGLALVFNVCLLLCVACLSPLTTSVGCMVTIPLSVLVDFLWHSLEPGWGDAVGAVLVAGGFALLVFEPPSKWSCLCHAWRCCRRRVAVT